MAQQLTELQEKWLQALESGEYKQGRDRLKSDDRYCCLGVACLVCGKIFVDGECEGLTEHPPESVISALRLRSRAGASERDFSIGDRMHYCLTNANDDGVTTHAEIAAAIRANPENFFLPPEAQS